MIINVKVKPNSKKEEVVKISEKEYIVFLKEPAREGKANAKLLKLLSKEFKGCKLRIKNPSSKKKVIEIT